MFLNGPKLRLRKILPALVSRLPWTDIMADVVATGFLTAFLISCPVTTVHYFRRRKARLGHIFFRRWKPSSRGLGHIFRRKIHKTMYSVINDAAISSFSSHFVLLQPLLDLDVGWSTERNLPATLRSDSGGHNY